MKYFKKFYLWIIPLIVCSLLFACSGGGGVNHGSSATDGTATLQSIVITVAPDTGKRPDASAISQQFLRLLADDSDIYIPEGAMQRIAAYGLYSNGSIKDVTGEVNWSSTDTNVVSSITSTGEVHISVAGSTTLTANFGSISGQVLVKVINASLSSITMSPYPGMSQSSTAGVSSYYKVSAVYDDKTTSNISSMVTWSSSSPDVATVDSYGEITPVASGTTTISASYNGLTASLPFTVTDATLKSITISTESLIPPIGVPELFTAIGVYSDGGNRDITNSVTWSSDNTAVANFDSVRLNQLNVLADTGSTNVTASLNDVVSQTITITPSNAVLTSISLDPTSGSIPLGNCHTFKAIGNYSDNASIDITQILSWSSSNSAIATIPTPGNVCITGSNPSAVGNQVIITATKPAGTSASATVTIDPAILTGISIAADQESGVVDLPITLTATGTYSDNTIKDISNEVSWNATPSSAVSLSANILTPTESGASVTVNATDSGISASQAISLTIYPKQILLYVPNYPGRTKLIPYSTILLPSGVGFPNYIFFFANYLDKSHHTFLVIRDATWFGYTVANPDMVYMSQSTCAPTSLVPAGYSAGLNCFVTLNNAGRSPVGAETTITFTDSQHGVSNTYPAVVVP